MDPHLREHSLSARRPRSLRRQPAFRRRHITGSARENRAVTNERVYGIRRQERE